MKVANIGSSNEWQIERLDACWCLIFALSIHVLRTFGSHQLAPICNAYQCSRVVSINHQHPWPSQVWLVKSGLNPQHKWLDSTHGSWFWEKFPPRSGVLWRNPCCAWAGFDGPSLYPPLFWDPVTRVLMEGKHTHVQKIKRRFGG